MSISDIVNRYGKIHSPYMGGLVNHLPMGQLALYKMTGSLKAVKEYSEKFTGMYEIDRVREEYTKSDSLEECLGKRDMYEAALSIIRGIEKTSEKERLLTDVLNRYRSGMSSGLFHVTIRLAYAVEGWRMDPAFEYELDRALSYYLTAYREAGVFEREVREEQIFDEIQSLTESISLTGSSLGHNMKSLYNDSGYMDAGFVVDGSFDDKFKSALSLSVRGYLNSGSIVALHCITGLHALSVLKEYYEEPETAADIMMTCAITHMIASDITDYGTGKVSAVGGSWDEIIEKASKSTDVHAIKLCYSSSELYRLYGLEELKAVAIKRIEG